MLYIKGKQIWDSLAFYLTAAAVLDLTSKSVQTQTRKFIFANKFKFTESHLEQMGLSSL